MPNFILSKLPTNINMKIYALDELFIKFRMSNQALILECFLPHQHPIYPIEKVSGDLHP